MEAIVLAGGLGTRLREVVNDCPKPMAPVGGRPFLEILLSSLSDKGFSRVVLSLGYMAEKIASHFGSRYSDMDIEYVVEGKPLGTGGATRLATEVCNEDHVYVFNGDTYLDFEVNLLEFQWQVTHHPIVVGRHTPNTARYGRLIIDSNFKLSSFSEKGISGPGLINAGCYVLSKDALTRFPLNKSFSIENDYLIPEVENASVDVFVTKGLFIDIGIPEDYFRAQSVLANI